MFGDNCTVHHHLKKIVKKHQQPMVGLGILSFVALAVFVFSGLQDWVFPQGSVSAGIGDPGNVKVTLTNELGAAVSGATVGIVCDGSVVSFSDNSMRDLDATVGTIEITPTFGDIATTGCSTNGEAVHVTFSSTNGTLVTKTVDSTLTLSATNQITIPTIQYPLAVTMKDAFDADVTPDVITYGGNAPTATSGSTSYWSSTAGSGALAVQKAGYVNASATNAGLTAVSVGTSSRTSITFGNTSAVSSAVSAGSSIIVKGLSPTVKIVVTTTNNSSVELSAVTVEKSTNGGTTFSAFTPSNVSSNVGYDAANPSTGAIIYRFSLTNYQTLTADEITPVATEQTVLTASLAPQGQAPGSSTAARISVGSLVVTPSGVVAPALPDNLIVQPSELTAPPVPPVDPTREPPAWQLVLPPPTVLSPTSIQWNIPLDIPIRFLPNQAVLSRLDTTSGIKTATVLNSKVLTPQTTEWFIIETDLTPGTLYENRTLSLDNIRGYYVFPPVKTQDVPPPALTISEQSSPQKPVILLSPSVDAREKLAAIVDRERQVYLQADGSFGREPEWRPFYKWGWKQAGSSTQRTILFDDSVLPGTYQLSLQIQTEDSLNTYSEPLTIVYAP